jgi:starch phosphorylase
MEPEKGPRTARSTTRSTFNRSQNKLYRPEFESGSVHSEKLWELMAEYIDDEVGTIQKSIVSHVEYTLARTRFNFDKSSCYLATALSIRDRLIESWNDTSKHFSLEDHKRVYYMSLEFLMGRAMQNALVNLNLESRYREALMQVGFKLEELYEEEADAALGNGGLGRLAACFLDSLATLDYPAWGYGIRYDYGIFRQKIIHGFQVEVPDYWLIRVNPWEIERSDICYNVHFGGRTVKYWEGSVERVRWEPAETVVAVAYDTPIPGYDTFNTINLRLWRSRPTNEFDFQAFNSGDYFKAIETRQKAEFITSVLYPNDSTESGKELRLKQQYFFCCATMQDVIRRFLKKEGRQWEELPDKVAFQLNDTHPAISIPELLRILIDEHKLDWHLAWKLTTRVFAYTNHTVLPEALERWTVDLLGRLLPRHLEIIYFINHIFMEKVAEKYVHDSRKYDLMREMSLIEESSPKMIRMANLCIVSSHSVNGVAALHSKLLVENLFWHFNAFFPKKFQNKTNGVTPRRWIHCANRSLSDLFSRHIGDYSWLTDMSQLTDLETMCENEDFHNEWREIKHNNKIKLAAWVKDNTGIVIPTDAMYDIMCKRIHEYKRQHLFALYIVHRYLTLKDMNPRDRASQVKRVFMVGGKAAPGYVAAKKIIKMINAIGDVVNNDHDIGDLMKVVYLPNYCVSAAQVILPAADLSEQISTAGTEASGTGNMKFVMNGAIIIGTLDGANVEIAEEVGNDNIFIFGAKVTEVPALRQKVSRGEIPIGQRLTRVFNELLSGRFGNARDYASVIETIRGPNDFYLVCADFYPYLDAQAKADKVYQNVREWTRMSVWGSIHMGKFSSDRTIEEYANDIWHISPAAIPTPAESAISRVRSQPFLYNPNTKESKFEEAKSVDIALLESTLERPEVEVAQEEEVAS